VGSQEIARGARRASLALNVVDYLPAGPQRAQSAWLGPFRRHRRCWERLLAVNLNHSDVPEYVRNHFESRNEDANLMASRPIAK
jgi:hypothetical protein